MLIDGKELKYEQFLIRLMSNIHALRVHLTILIAGHSEQGRGKAMEAQAGQGA